MYATPCLLLYHAGFWLTIAREVGVCEAAASAAAVQTGRTTGRSTDRQHYRMQYRPAALQAAVQTAQHYTLLAAIHHLYCITGLPAGGQL